MLLRYVLIRQREEKDRSAVALVTGNVKYIMEEFINLTDHILDHIILVKCISNSSHICYIE